jgi:hypothetical protein
MTSNVNNTWDNARGSYQLIPYYTICKIIATVYGTTTIQLLQRKCEKYHIAGL